MNATARLASLRARIARENCSAMIVSQPVNVAYLTGFEGVFDEEPATVLVVSAEWSWLYTDTRYFEAVRTAAVDTPWDVREPVANVYEAVCDEIIASGLGGTVALEDSVPYGRFRFIAEKLESDVLASRSWIEEIRQVKDAEELRRVEAAAELTDRAFTHVLGVLKPGMTERDIALEIEMFLRRGGSEGVAFPAIVASGPNSALPHAKPSERAIAVGDFVKMDFGARVQGYCADLTRTVVLGTASDRQREIHASVLAANRAGVEAVIPGRAGRDVDAIARAVIDEAGFGQFFGHGLGHGVGMAVHELPTVGQRGRTPLASGNVITIEPGIYVPGFGGVRIEDLVAVTTDGCRVLSSSPRELIEV